MAGSRRTLGSHCSSVPQHGERRRHLGASSTRHQLTGRRRKGEEKPPGAHTAPHFHATTGPQIHWPKSGVITQEKSDAIMDACHSPPQTSGARVFPPDRCRRAHGGIQVQSAHKKSHRRAPAYLASWGIVDRRMADERMNEWK